MLFVCSGKSIEVNLLRQSGIDFKVIAAGKYRRYGRGKLAELTDIPTQWQNLRDSGKIVRGYLQARKIIKSFQPDVVFIKGGYVGVPVGYAAAKAKIPLILHESDVVMGRANQFLSKYAQKIAVGFPVDAYSAELENKLVFTGNPVRSDFVENAANTERRMPLNKQKPNIFLFAGSQGAADLNRIVWENIEPIVKSCNLLHVTGEQGIEQARVVRHRLPQEMQRNYEVHSFLKSEMAQAYQWADVVVSRAGMNTLAELAALSKPAIIIPLPSSTNNHQLKNAQYLARAGGIRLMPQHELTGLKLMHEISQLVENDEAREYLQTTIHKFYQPQATSHIAQLISSIVKNGAAEWSEMYEEFGGLYPTNLLNDLPPRHHLVNVVLG